MEKPLNVRCAEALGWTSKQLPPLGHHPGPTAWRNPETGIEGCYVPPYGDDTPEGWACTGPLLDRIARMADRVEIVESQDADGGFVCLSAAGPNLSVTVRGGIPCAIAEWFAQFGAAC